MIIGGDRGPAVVLSARTAAYLEKYAGLAALRVRTRGPLADIARELTDLREAAVAYRGTVLPEAEATLTEVATDSAQWLTSIEVADREQISDSAVRLACREGRIPDAFQVGGRWRISREAAETYRAARAAA